MVFALVFFVGSAGAPAFDFINVAIGEASFVEEGSIGLFDGEVESPKVTPVLITGSGLGGFVDDTEVKVVGIGAGHAGELVGPVGKGFIKSAHAAIDSCPRTCAGIEGESVP